VSDQPVEDRGRPLGAPAGRAREPAAPLTEPRAGSTPPAAAPEGPSALDLARARGKLFVVTGPSGAGKGTLIRRLVGRRPDLDVAVSATTRPQRTGEADGRDYHFLSEDEFVERARAGEFLEHVVYVSGQRYGTLRAEVERILARGRSCVLELETEGARRVKELLPESVTVFVEPPSFAELERRLRERATESAGEIDERLDLARRQMDERHRFDHVIVNDDVDRAVRDLEALIDEELDRRSAARTTAELS
jgi:guanylate kinase